MIIVETAEQAEFFTMLFRLTPELLFPFGLGLLLVGFAVGLLLGWHLTGKYYRKLVAELIERHCALTGQMRMEHVEHAQASTSAA